MGAKMIKKVCIFILCVMILIGCSACSFDIGFLSFSVDSSSEAEDDNGLTAEEKNVDTDKNIYDYSQKEAVTNIVTRLPYDSSIPIEECRSMGTVGFEGKVVKINNIDRTGSINEAANHPIAFTQDILDVLGALTYKSMELGEIYVEFCTVKDCIIFESSFETANKIIKSENLSSESVMNSIQKSLGQNKDRVTKKTYDSNETSDYKILYDNDRLNMDISDVDTRNYKYQLTIVCDVKVVRVYTIKGSVNLFGSPKETYEAVYKCTELVQTGPSKSIWFKASI